MRVRTFSLPAAKKDSHTFALIFGVCQLFTAAFSLTNGRHNHPNLNVTEFALHVALGALMLGHVAITCRGRGLLTGFARRSYDIALGQCFFQMLALAGCSYGFVYAMIHGTIQDSALFSVIEAGGATLCVILLISRVTRMRALVTAA